MALPTTSAFNDFKRFDFSTFSSIDGKSLSAALNFARAGKDAHKYFEQIEAALIENGYKAGKNRQDFEDSAIDIAMCYRFGLFGYKKDNNAFFTIATELKIQGFASGLFLLGCYHEAELEFVRKESDRAAIKAEMERCYNESARQGFLPAKERELNIQFASIMEEDLSEPSVTQKQTARGGAKIAPQPSAKKTSDLPPKRPTKNLLFAGMEESSSDPAVAAVKALPMTQDNYLMSAEELQRIRAQSQSGGNDDLGLDGVSGNYGNLEDTLGDQQAQATAAIPGSAPRGSRLRKLFRRIFSTNSKA